MATNFTRVAKEDLISKDIDLPPEEKKELPPPKILSDVYETDDRVCIDIEDYLGRNWTIVAVKRTTLRQKLRYFKTLPVEVLEALFPVPILAWRKIKGKSCGVCGDICRVHPRLEVFGCAKCNTTGGCFIEVVRKVTPKTESSTDEKPAKKPKAKKIVEEKPATVEKPMSRLMQKMKQNKAE